MKLKKKVSIINQKNPNFKANKFQKKLKKKQNKKVKLRKLKL